MSLLIIQMTPLYTESFTKPMPSEYNGVLSIDPVHLLALVILYPSLRKVTLNSNPLFSSFLYAELYHFHNLTSGFMQAHRLQSETRTCL